MQVRIFFFVGLFDHVHCTIQSQLYRPGWEPGQTRVSRDKEQKGLLSLPPKRASFFFSPRSHSLILSSLLYARYLAMSFLMRL